MVSNKVSYVAEFLLITISQIIVCRHVNKWLFMLLLHQKLRIGAENGKWLELINITKYTLSILAPFPRSSRWVRVHKCTITMVLTRSNISCSCEVMTENVSWLPRPNVFVSDSWPKHRAATFYIAEMFWWRQYKHLSSSVFEQHFTPHCWKQRAD